MVGSIFNYHIKLLEWKDLCRALKVIYDKLHFCPPKYITTVVQWSANKIILK